MRAPTPAARAAAEHTASSRPHRARATLRGPLSRRRRRAARAWRGPLRGRSPDSPTRRHTVHHRARDVHTYTHTHTPIRDTPPRSPSAPRRARDTAPVRRAGSWSAGWPIDRPAGRQAGGHCAHCEGAAYGALHWITTSRPEGRRGDRADCAAPNAARTICLAERGWAVENGKPLLPGVIGGPGTPGNAIAAPGSGAIPTASANQRHLGMIRQPQDKPCAENASSESDDDGDGRDPPRTHDAQTVSEAARSAVSAAGGAPTAEAAAPAHPLEHQRQCLHCGRVFSRSDRLLAHVRIHTGEAPYKCSVHGCDRRFKESAGLAKHVRMHSSARPYGCGVCQATFKHSHHLKRHTAKLHGTAARRLSRSQSATVSPASATAAPSRPLQHAVSQPVLPTVAAQSSDTTGLLPLRPRPTAAIYAPVPIAPLNVFAPSLPGTPYAYLAYVPVQPYAVQRDVAPPATQLPLYPTASHRLFTAAPLTCSPPMRDESAGGVYRQQREAPYVTLLTLVQGSDTAPGAVSSSTMATTPPPPLSQQQHAGQIASATRAMPVIGPTFWTVRDQTVAAVPAAVPSSTPAQPAGAIDAVHSGPWRWPYRALFMTANNEDRVLSTVSAETVRPQAPLAPLAPGRAADTGSVVRCAWEAPPAASSSDHDYAAPVPAAAEHRSPHTAAPATDAMAPGGASGTAPFTIRSLLDVRGAQIGD